MRPNTTDMKTSRITWKSCREKFQDFFIFLECG